MKTENQDPALLVGLDTPDDAAVYRVAPDTAIVQTVDFFTPIVDDAYSWGRIAAANALSDVYAMGARPVTALNLVGWPRELDFSILGRVLEGAAAACADGDTSVVGGHSIDDPEPKFGLSVTGLVHPDRVVRKVGGRVGDDLVLTKPLGMGIISSGIKESRTSPATALEAMQIMGELNRAAAEVMVEVGPSSATDVTGFGLVGHLLQMLGEGVAAELRFDAIPLLAEAIGLAAEGVLPGGSKRNLEAMADRVRCDGLDDARTKVLFDAQTSGGLLMAVPPERTDELMARLKTARVEHAAVIGRLIEGSGDIEVLAD